jgi:hypothetical protein
MITFFDRYRNGEYQQVWEELLILGSKIREEPFYSDALAVVQETMLRARHNLEVLVNRLKTLNYSFAAPEKILSPLNKREIALIDEFEQKVGGFPLSVKIWFQFVGEVNFQGSTSTPLNFLQHLVDPDVASNSMEHNFLDVYYDPIQIFFLTPYLEDFLKTPEDIPMYLELCPDFAAKAGDSGGIYYIKVPNQSIDAVFPSNNLEFIEETTGELTTYFPQDFTFVKYLRECFKWGGFPGLKNSKNPLSKDFFFLTKDLLPI